jgi:hypothetical protein
VVWNGSGTTSWCYHRLEVLASGPLSRSWFALGPVATAGFRGSAQPTAGNLIAHVAPWPPVTPLVALQFSCCRRDIVDW